MLIGNNNIDQMGLQKKRNQKWFTALLALSSLKLFFYFLKENEKNEFSVICSWFNFIDLFFPYIDQYN